ncbi:MAG: hypothetical protein C4K60_07840 [Ideonella sp. MAG2]|nr:MAG: hypothetical protein C4K60_07840 [Ideonella sp. MAG2]
MKAVILQGSSAAPPPPVALAYATRASPHTTLPTSQRPRDTAPTSRHGVVALSDTGAQWALVNMAANVADRLQADAAAHNHIGWCDAQHRAIVLTDAQVDHVAGLLSLRDGSPIDLYATPAVFEALSRSLPVLPVLQHYCGVHWHIIPVAGETQCANFRIEQLPHLEFTALATQGPTPPYLAEHETQSAAGHSIAIAVRDRDSGQRLFCAPGAVALGYTELDWMRSADCVLIDGLTTWPADEAQDDWLARRKVLLGVAQRAQGGACPDGFECASDGMVIDL